MGQLFSGVGVAMIGSVYTDQDGRDSRYSLVVIVALLLVFLLRCRWNQGARGGETGMFRCMCATTSSLHIFDLPLLRNWAGLYVCVVRVCMYVWCACVRAGERLERVFRVLFLLHGAYVDVILTGYVVSST